MRKIKDIIELMRVKHWVKNIIIFMPIVLAGNLTQYEKLCESLVAFIIFSLVATIIYIVNDMHDIEADRIHPTKQNRPLPSGRITLLEAKILLVTIAFACIIIWNLLSWNINYIVIPVLYLVINLCYSFGLKNIPLLDIFILMLGYVFRLEYGGIISGIEISSWMFLTMVSAAFFLGIGKRRNELLKYGSKSRKNLSYYTIDFLNQSLQFSMILAVVFYSLACADTNTSVANAGVNLLWSVPVILIICLRYLMLLNGESDGDPITIIFDDKILLGLIVLYIMIVVLMIYI